MRPDWPQGNLLAPVARQQNQSCACRLMGLFGYKQKQSLLEHTGDLTHWWKQWIPPEVFQLLGHFRNLEALNLVGVTLLGVIREQVWSGPVLWGQRVTKLKGLFCCCLRYMQKRTEFYRNTVTTWLTKVIGYVGWDRHSENLFVKGGNTHMKMCLTSTLSLEAFMIKRKTFWFCCYL